MRTIHRVFFVWEFDKEERWLNEMAAKGQLLTEVGFCRYVFEDGEPGVYQYRLELLEDAPSSPEGHSYIRFLEDTGAEQVGTLLRWVYFRKRTEDGPFDLFSDFDSRIAHLRRMLVMLTPILMLMVCNTVAQLGHLHTCVGIVTGAVGLLVAYGIVRIIRKMRHLQKERAISEG